MTIIYDYSDYKNIKGSVGKIVKSPKLANTIFMLTDNKPFLIYSKRVGKYWIFFKKRDGKIDNTVVNIEGVDSVGTAKLCNQKYPCLLEVEGTPLRVIALNRNQKYGYVVKKYTENPKNSL